MLAHIGAATRRRVQFVLLLAALSLGLVREVIRPQAWRRTLRAEYRRVLTQSLGGGLWSVLVTAGLVGVALVNQALFWLERAG
jgi:phospholipid/cholesterol/gamma-HCH transport system permease protein